MTAVVVRKEFFAQVKELNEQKPTFLKDWASAAGKGVRLGAADAPVQVIEFADFECPFCAEFHGILARLRAKYPAQIAVIYVHFPIPGHRFAVPAARVAECAGEQGQFERMHDSLFEHQEALGLKPWTEFARQAEVPDMAAFDLCIERTDPVSRVLAGQSLGKTLDIQGTPSVIVNGWRLGRPPTEKELDGMVSAILAGRAPVTPDGKLAQ